MIAPPKPPSPDQLEALIKEARDRQRRRRLLGAGAVGIVAAAGLALYAAFGGGSAGSLGTSPARAGRATGPLCRSSQLSAAVFFQGATQTMAGGATITNTGGSACTLPTGRPTVSVSWRGTQISLREHSAQASSFAVAHVLAPGAKAVVTLQWWDRWFCGTRLQSYTFDPRFVLRFGSGSAVAATAEHLPVPNCGKPGGWIDVSRPLVQH